MLEAIKESGLAACISGNCMVRFSIHFFPTLRNILCNRLSWLENDPGLASGYVTDTVLLQVFMFVLEYHSQVLFLI